MGKGKYTYVVCAKVYGTDTPESASTAVMAGQPVVRRLNRIERVALAFEGTLVRRSDRWLLLSFPSADAAFFGACEMQRRCADLPRYSSKRLLLQIGIHRASPMLRKPAMSWLIRKKPERRDHNRRMGFEAASRLASVSGGDAIVVSGLVLESLAPTVRAIGEQISPAASELPAQAFYWRTVLKNQRSAQSPGQTEKDSSPRLILRLGERVLEIDTRNTLTTFGRDPGCDVRVSNRFASRLHARLEIVGDTCILTDQSSNGTSVTFADGKSAFLWHESLVLHGKGWLGFGQSQHASLHEKTEFELLETQEKLTPIKGQAPAD